MERQEPNAAGDRPGTDPAGPVGERDLPKPPVPAPEPIAKQEACAREGTILQFEAIVRGMDRIFMQETLKRLKPQT